MKNSLSLFLKSILIFTLVLVFSLPVYSEESEITTGETSEYIFMEDSEAIDIFGSAFEDFTIEEKILILREIFPAGTYWNGYNYNGEGERYLNVSNIGCAHKSGIENCNAYVGKTKNYFPDDGTNNIATEHDYKCRVVGCDRKCYTIHSCSANRSIWYRLHSKSLAQNLSKKHNNKQYSSSKSGGIHAV